MLRVLGLCGLAEQAVLDAEIRIAMRPARGVLRRQTVAGMRWAGEAGEARRRDASRQCPLLMPRRARTRGQGLESDLERTA
jgi:hypothetical protein